MNLNQYLIEGESLPDWGTPERREVRVALLDLHDTLLEQLRALDNQCSSQAENILEMIWRIDAILYNAREEE